MSCAELLLELRNLGARVWLEDDRLRVAAPQGALTNEIRRELKDRRSELLDWLKRQGSARPALVAQERVGAEIAVVVCAAAVVVFVPDGRSGSGVQHSVGAAAGRRAGCEGAGAGVE